MVAVPELLSAALDHAASGRRVFPVHSSVDGRCSCPAAADCDRPAKHPRIKDWQKRATTDPATIRRWWSEWPDANIGIPTGETFDALDIDGAKGEASLSWLGHGGEIHVLTPHGRHFWYWPTGRGNRVGILPGVDWRGRGGYVLAPPSVVDGAVYRFEDGDQDRTVGEFIPARLLDLLGSDQSQKPIAPPDGAGQGPTTAYGAAALEAEAAEVATTPEGERNDRLNVAAFRAGQVAASGEVNLNDAGDRLLDAAVAAGLPADEAVRTIRSGLSAGLRKPRAHAQGGTDFWPPGPLPSSGQGAEDPEGQPGGDPLPPRGYGVKGRRLSTVVRRNVEWLWSQRIPIGKLTLLVGDPGVGKSYLYLALGAPLTRGEALPLTPAADPASMAVFQAEDDPEDTIGPRADLLGVDDERVLLVEEFSADGKRVPFMPEHVPALEEHLDALPNPRLLIIDPVASLVGGKVDTYRDNQVRTALAPLVELAQRRRIAVVSVVHMNKDQAKKALYRAAGSVGFVGLARSVLLAAKEEDTGRRAVVAIKHNLTGESVPLEYRVTEVGFEWLGEAPELTAERLLAVPVGEEERTALEDARAFLVDQLTGGERRSKEVEAAAREKGIAAKTLKRARKDLRVRADQQPTGRAGANEWWLTLPSQAGGWSIVWPE